MTNDPKSRPPDVDGEGRLRLVVPADEAGSRVDRMLGRLLAPDYSRSYLSAQLGEGLITVNGGAVRPSFRVEPEMVIEGTLKKAATSLPEPQDLGLDILHADDQILVVNKPVGLIIHPGSGAKEDTLVNGLLHMFPEIQAVGRADRPGIVHRLDRDTSGVMVVARTNDAARSLVNQFKTKQVQKNYTAFVWGEMPFDSDWIDLPIGPHCKRPQLRAVVPEDGQSASSFYTVERRYGMASRVDVSPRTGRTHQIRVHLDHIGFPILGDASYGSAKQESWRRWRNKREKAEQRVPVLARQALHARRLSFCHPATEARVVFESPLPADLLDLSEVLDEAAAHVE
jgi:23S rRNA pseudouridine1911/1915/1917 synthase